MPRLRSPTGALRALHSYHARWASSADLIYIRAVSYTHLEQLIRSAVSNWEQLNGRKADEGELYVSKIYVDEGVTLKRLQIGRAHV